MHRRLFASAFVLASSLAACGGSTSDSTPLPVAGGDDDSGATTTPGDDSGSTPVGHDAGTTGPDTGTPIPDAGPTQPGVDASYPNDPADGPPTRQQCTGTFGSALSASGVHGRLDGTVVSIVAPKSPGGQACNGDSSHLHLQILMGGSVYDVATNLDTLYFEQDMAMPNGGAWSEGWHTTDALDYANIGVHNGSFTQPASQSALTSLLEAALANANHLSVYATAYGPDGIHDVHRRGPGGIDGALVIDPLAPTSHVFFFCFTGDTF